MSDHNIGTFDLAHSCLEMSMIVVSLNYPVALFINLDHRDTCVLETAKGVLS
jgi:hypothetical protein